MTNPSPAAETRTALELIAECVARLRMTDPADTAAALLADWHGFGTAQAAGTLLAQDNFDDAALARNTRPVFAAVIERLRPAPSLPYTDPVVEAVDGLVPDGFRPDKTPSRSMIRMPNRTPLRLVPCAAASSRSRSS